MSGIDSTRLRYVSSSNVDDLTLFITTLRFKVEIKGGPMFINKRWFLFFILPENEGIQMENINL